MFNGLIRNIAKVKSFKQNILELESDLEPNLGDSIAVNGVCLSVIYKFSGGYALELSQTTKECVAIENFKGRVHVESALCFGDKIDGHLVQGHIDAIGEISKINNLNSGYDFYINLPQKIMPLMSAKGSVCVDGVSLTIKDIFNYGIIVTLIPLSFKDSLFGEFKVGRRVNIESDLLARYINRQLNFKKDFDKEAVKFLSLY